MSFEGFPFPECLQKHSLDFCFEKECKELRTHDNGQTYYCAVVMGKLEQQHPPKPTADENQKDPYCWNCNNSTDFIKERNRFRCAKCGKYASKMLGGNIEALQWGIRAGILRK